MKLFKNLAPVACIQSGQFGSTREPSAWGITLLGSKLPSVRVAERGAVCPLATANRSLRLPGRAAVSAAALARRFLSLLKLLWRIADYPIVQKAAFLYGIILALSAATLGGIGDWAAERIR